MDDYEELQHSWEDCEDGESDVQYSECAVIDGSGVYDWLEIKTGVKQGFYTSGFFSCLLWTGIWERPPNKGIQASDGSATTS